MRLAPGTLGMTAVLALLTAIGPLSTDMYLPSLPAITEAFGTTLPRVQLTLSFYLAGFAVGQIFYGPVSDKIGRRPVILTGLAIYCIASAICAFAPTVEWLIAARFLQALGAAGPIVLGRAIVRDLYDGSRAGLELSRMGMIMGFVPMIAPVLGGVLETTLGWRANFLAVLVGVAILSCVVYTMLPETLKQRRAEPISLVAIFKGFGLLLRHPDYRTYVAIVALSYGGLFSFISGSSFILQGIYGLTPLTYGAAFGATVMGFVGGSIIAQKLIRRMTMDGVIGVGVACLSAGGILMLILMIVSRASSAEVFLPMAIYAAGVGMVLPQASAGAMMPFPDRAGAASSLQGLLQMSFAATFAGLMSLGLSWSPLVMPMAISLMGCAAVAVFAIFRRNRSAA
jgi:MFS transporter, DHA1 family, multidrug resistance protein